MLCNLRNKSEELCGRIAMTNSKIALKVSIASNLSYLACKNNERFSSKFAGSFEDVNELHHDRNDCHVEAKMNSVRGKTLISQQIKSNYPFQKKKQISKMVKVELTILIHSHVSAWLQQRQIIPLSFSILKRLDFLNPNWYSILFPMDISLFHPNVI